MNKDGDRWRNRCSLITIHIVVCLGSDTMNDAPNLMIGTNLVRESRSRKRLHDLR